MTMVARIEAEAVPKRWTVADMRRLEEAFPETRVELIEGEFYDKMGQRPPHAATSSLVMRWLVSVFGFDRIREQKPLRLTSDDRETSEPEPDLMVLKQSFEGFFTRHPTPSDLVLLVEISDTTRTLDLGRKAALYSRNGVPEYWVVDLVKAQLVIHTEPALDGYKSIRRFDGSDLVTIFDRSVRVSELLPPDNI